MTDIEIIAFAKYRARCHVERDIATDPTPDLAICLSVLDDEFNVSSISEIEHLSRGEPVGKRGQIVKECADFLISKIDIAMRTI